MRLITRQPRDNQILTEWSNCGYTPIPIKCEEPWLGWHEILGALSGLESQPVGIIAPHIHLLPRLSPKVVEDCLEECDLLIFKSVLQPGGLQYAPLIESVFCKSPLPLSLVSHYPEALCFGHHFWAPCLLIEAILSRCTVGYLKEVVAFTAQRSPGGTAEEYVKQAAISASQLSPLHYGRIVGTFGNSDSLDEEVTPEACQIASQFEAECQALIWSQVVTLNFPTSPAVYPEGMV